MTTPDLEDLQIQVELEASELETKDAKLRPNSSQYQSEVTDLKHMGLIRMWDTESGEPHWILRSMAVGQLKKKRNGVPAFTVHDPGIRPVKGDKVCPLHPDSPERAKFDEFGFAVCRRRGKFRSDFNRMEHFRSKHPVTWAAWQRELAREQTAKGDTVQEALVALLAERQEANVTVVNCPQCDWFREHWNPKVAAMLRGQHISAEHGEKNAE